MLGHSLPHVLAAPPRRIGGQVAIALRKHRHIASFSCPGGSLARCCTHLPAASLWGRGSAPTKARSLGRTSHCTFRCANALAGTLTGCLRCDLLRLPCNADTGVSARKSWTPLRRPSAVGHALRAHARHWLAFL